MQQIAAKKHKQEQSCNRAMDPTEPVLSKRQQKTEEIAKSLYERLDLQYVQQTGSLFPSQSLRHRASRDKLSFMQTFQYDGVERLLTERMARCVLQMLLEWGLQIPSAPGMDTRKWLDVTSKVLHKMLKKARRGSGGAMDEDETQVGDDGLDRSEGRGPRSCGLATLFWVYAVVHAWRTRKS